jgi:hypothetical protein
VSRRQATSFQLRGRNNDIDLEPDKFGRDLGLVQVVPG